MLEDTSPGLSLAIMREQKVFVTVICNDIELKRIASVPVCVVSVVSESKLSEFAFVVLVLDFKIVLP